MGYTLGLQIEALNIGGASLLFSLPYPDPCGMKGQVNRESRNGGATVELHWEALCPS